MASQLDDLTEWTVFILQLALPFEVSGENSNQWLQAVRGIPLSEGTSGTIGGDDTGHRGLIWRREGKDCGADAIAEKRLACGGGPLVAYADWQNHMEGALAAFEEITDIHGETISEMAIQARFSIPCVGNNYARIAETYLASSPLGALLSSHLMWDARLEIKARTQVAHPYDWVLTVTSNQPRAEIIAGNLDEEDNRLAIEITGIRASEDLADSPLDQSASRLASDLRELMVNELLSSFVTPFASVPDNSNPS